MSAPIRTCVGCRTRRPQSELLRVKRQGHGAIAPALPASRGSAGRSAYLCPSRICLDQAIRRGGIQRAFARVGRVTVDGGALWSALRQSIGEQRALYERSSRDPRQHPRFRQLLAFENAFETATLASGREA